jgi:cellulose biosynthesis protein BcsQ
MYLDIEKIKKLPKITNKVIINNYKEEILNLLEKGLNTKEIHNYLKNNLPNYENSYSSFQKAIQRLKNLQKKQNNREKEMSNKEIKKKKFILLANDKGGVGKTTLGTLLNLPNSIILNLDTTREIANIYSYKKVVDFGRVEEEENISLEDFLELLNNNKDFENIIIDTKGGITNELMKTLPYIDSVIIPIKIGATSEQPSYEFIVQLKSYLDELNNKDIKWAIVYNEISPKFLKKTGFGKYELIDEFKQTEKSLKNDLLGDKLKVITYFKRSEAITTRERERKDIKDLMKNNFGAYLVIQKEIERLNNDLKDIFE